MKLSQADTYEELIIKSLAEPGLYGYRPYERPTSFYLDNGIINIDKPRGPTSHMVTKLIKRILEYSGKIGHCGTLDPKVSGVLPVVLGNATKLSRIIANSDKEYIGVLYIHDNVSQEELNKASKRFLGPIFQRPPVKSAVKRSLRIREVYSIDLLESEGRFHLIKVHVESGTYIRKLFFDIGEYLGVGGSMRELRRIRSGIFDEKNSVTLQQLYEAYQEWKRSGDDSELRRVILPLEVAIKDMPKIVIKDSAVASVAYGASLKAKGVGSLTKDIEKGRTVAIITLKGELVAIGKSIMNSDEIVKAEEGIVAEINRVVMPRDLYPPMWKPKKKNEPDNGAQ